ncbi:MAG: ABC-2 family transporter protein [Bryobacterales bacterium]|nr:ABC-2 family transporter protein [Bryobacterales bacterium]MDE0294954.1 ABC-2 family transporter protein [Bryobacterales bacterium]MDE0435100.1 ABC-2 family transporter protein [Bryobacterales bacterium]
MGRYLQLLGQYFLQYAKVRLAYKGDFVVSVITTMIATAFGIALVFILFQRAPEIAGWRFHEILFLYGFGLIPLSLFNVVSINLYYFGESYIVEGKFDRILLRPVHSLFQVMSEQFRLEALSDTATGLFIVAYTSNKLGLQHGPEDWAFLGAAALCGLIIYLAVFLMLTCVSFWVEDRVGIIPPVYNMLAFGRYPLNIYSPLVQFLLSWVIPFAFASFYPSTVLLERMEYQSYVALLPLVMAVFLTGAIVLWNRGVANYSSTGT